MDGVPRMMAGAGRAHDRIVANTLRVIGNQLLASRCEPFTADTFIRIPGGNYRMADAGVECGTPEDVDRAAREPRLVVEVRSPSTRYFDVFGKLEEYKSVPSLQYVLLIGPDVAQATLWSRNGEWRHETVAGVDAVVRLPLLDLTLALSELYFRVEPSRPRLVI